MSEAGNNFLQRDKRRIGAVDIPLTGRMILGLFSSRGALLSTSP